MNTTLTESLKSVESRFSEMIAELNDAAKRAQSSGMPTDEFITVQEAADFLGTTKGYIYARVNRLTNPIPSFQDGTTRIRKSSFEEWIARNEKS